MLIQHPRSGALDGGPFIGYDDRYEDRAIAGRRLADLLPQYRGSRAIVLALPPGGVAVAAEVAQALRLPFDVLIARTFVVRPYPDRAAGALSEGGGLCFDAAVLRLPGVLPGAAWREASRAQREITVLIDAYRHHRPLPLLARRPVILVDDGLDGGLLQLAALQALRRLHPQRCIIATPGGTTAALQLIAPHADAIVALTHTTGALAPPVRSWRHGLGDDDSAILLERCLGSH